MIFRSQDQSSAGAHCQGGILGNLFLTTAISADRCLWVVYKFITQQSHTNWLHPHSYSWVSFRSTCPTGIFQGCSQSLGFLRTIPTWDESFILTPKARYIGEDSHFPTLSPNWNILLLPCFEILLNTSSSHSSPSSYKFLSPSF